MSVVVSILLAILVSLIVSGCATNIGVVSIGQDTYTVAKQTVGFSSQALFAQGSISRLMHQ